ncbi:MAG: hydroxyglutarate oxidase [Firmicutes bacterium]|nr:hydroxyglutarate oxidase [Bacillota bacterium]
MFDIAIVGGGIVGLATAVTLLKQWPSLRVVVLEKEANVAAHQTGHNSGVIHSGIYYKPGSLKANLCVDGVRRMTAFCEEHGIRYERCGKVIVATDNRELAALEELYRRGTANGVPGLRKISREELQEIEPHAAGIAALHSPNTGIVDYAEVSRAMAAELVQRGAAVQTGAEVRGIHQDGSGLRIETTAGEIAARFLINCAGLYSDEIARKMGIEPDVRIIPFRGEYYFLRKERQDLVRGLIYPVPDPQMPFLGVHFTRTVHGQVEAGPNAVLAFAREGYTKGRIRPGELWATLSYPGFRKLARRFWRTGLYEYYRSFSKAEFVRGLQRLVPEISMADVSPGGAGVRAQAVARDGNLVDDFRIVELPRAIHVLSAPSPAATASLAIGNYVGTLAMETFQRSESWMRSSSRQGTPY